MALKPTTQAPSFDRAVEGIWGQLRTSAGSVEYLQTRARLSTDPATEELHGLSGWLSIAREAFDVDKLDFDELLQRDIDDHRVATQLIPYILGKQGRKEPGFFPPILAVLLPYRAGRPSTFEAPAPSSPETWRGMPFSQIAYGKSFAVQRLLGDAGEPDALQYGRLLWAADRAQLVVIDGQHRAMALLAIARTLSKSWANVRRAASYATFYEEQVERLVPPGAILDIELPVTLAWFPDLTGQGAAGKRVHPAARRLFVDVNQSAKPPTKARATLLSEDDLLSVFLRSALNRMRGTDSALPLAAVEYDSSRDSATPQRWSTMITLESLKDSIGRCVFGPKELLSDPAKGMSRGPAASGEHDRCLRMQLAVGDLYGKTINDGDRVMQRNALGREYFPETQAARAPLLDAFADTWGAALIALFSETHPYSAHVEALKSLNSGWSAVDTRSKLAKEAIFSGVGLFQTLRDARDSGNTSPGVLEIWKGIEHKQGEFDVLRTRSALGLRSSTQPSERQIADVKNLFQSCNTSAAQVGLALALATLALRAGIDRKQLPDLARQLAASCTKAQQTSGAKAHQRRQLMSRRLEANPLNTLLRLEPARAVQFRYLWLQLAATSPTPKLLKFAQQALLDELLAEAKSAYLEHRYDEHARALRSEMPEATRQERLAKAKPIIDKQLQGAIKAWGLRGVAAKKPTGTDASIDDEEAILAAFGVEADAEL